MCANDPILCVSRFAKLALPVHRALQVQPVLLARVVSLAQPALPDRVALSVQPVLLARRGRLGKRGRSGRKGL